jgi:hypothetical protein
MMTKQIKDDPTLCPFLSSSIEHMHLHDVIETVMLGDKSFHHGELRRKIRLIECNTKCRYLNKLTSKGTSRQVSNLSEDTSPPLTPYSPPLTHCICVYSVLIHTGKGEGVRANQREG